MLNIAGWMVDMLLTFIGLLATAFSVASTLPQIRKALKTRDTEDVSIRFLVVLIVGLFLWAIYGLGRADNVIIIGNTIGVILNICMLALKIMFKKTIGGRLKFMCENYL
jgi:MtN3 and saliva related transmembrane protein